MIDYMAFSHHFLDMSWPSRVALSFSDILIQSKVFKALAAFLSKILFISRNSHKVRLAVPPPQPTIIVVNFKAKNKESCQITCTQ